MSQAPRMQPDNNIEIQLARLSQEFQSFQERLIGQDGIPGQLTNLEREFKDFREHLIDDIGRTMHTALQPVSSDIKRLSNEVKEIKGPNGFLAQHSSRIRAMEMWRKGIAGALLVISILFGYVIEVYLKGKS